jgi:hypothetical protein
MTIFLYEASKDSFCITDTECVICEVEIEGWMSVFKGKKHCLARAAQFCVCVCVCESMAHSRKGKRDVEQLADTL